MMTESPITTDLVAQSSNVGADISAIRRNDAAFYSSITGDDFDTKIAVASALANAEPLADHLNKPLRLANIIIQEVELLNEQTGTLDSAPRITLIMEDGTALAATSMGLFSSVKQLLGVAGDPERWPNPVDCYVVEQKGSKAGYKYFTLRYGKPSK